MISRVLRLLALAAIYVLPSTAFVVSPTTRASAVIPATPTSISTTSLAMGLELVDPSYNLAIGAFGVGLAGGFLEDLRDKKGEKLLTAKPF